MQPHTSQHMSISRRFLKGLLVGDYNCLWVDSVFWFTFHLETRATLHLYSGISVFLSWATTGEFSVLEGGDKIAESEGS